MNKIAITSLCWKRPEVFEAFCKNLTTLTPKPIVIVAGSESDQCMEIATRYGIHYERTQNRLLGKKANLSVRYAKDYDVDYIMLTGSDDLISQSLWESYVNFSGDVLGLKDLYFYNLPDKRAIHWKGYTQHNRINEPIGAYKLISREVMEKMQWRPFCEVSRTPDEHTTHAKLKALGVEQTVKTMAELGGIAVDLKSEANLTKFNLWSNSSYVVSEQFLNMDKGIGDLIRGIKF